MTVDVSILIVTWNSARWIGGCLRSIEPALGSLTCETFVYDNASADRTLDEIAATRCEFTVIASAANDGFAAGVNRTAARATGRYLLLLNPDCELRAESVLQLVEALDRQPEFAAAAPVLRDEWGAAQRWFQLRRLPTLRSLLAEVLLFDQLFPGNRSAAHQRYAELDITQPQTIEQPAAAAFLIRRSVFEEIGPMDERFRPAWYEDVDYCRRLADAGRRILLVPLAEALHHGGSSLASMKFDEAASIWYRNLNRYVGKWFSAPAAQAVRWATMAGMIMRIAATSAGFSPARAGRREAISAYVRVLREAFHSWDDPSPSS